MGKPTYQYIIPLEKKSTLSFIEAAEYSGLTVDILEAIIAENDCDFVLWIGKKKRINRRKLLNYILNHPDILN